MKSNLLHLLSLSIMLASLTVMIGWVLHIDSLTRLSTNQINMKFPTALCFFLSGLTLLFLAEVRKRRIEMAQMVIPGMTLIIFLIMATLLAAGLFGVHTGIENAFVSDLGDSATIVPGMPAIPTMIGFLLFGAVGLVSLFTPLYKNYFILSVGIGLIFMGGLAIIGYALHIPEMYYKYFETSTPMALNTAVLFCCLGMGLSSIVMTDI